LRRRSKAVAIIEKDKRSDIVNSLLMKSFRGGSKIPFTT